MAFKISLTVQNFDVVKWIWIMVGIIDKVC